MAFPPPRDNDTASNASTHSAASSRGGAFGGGGTPGHGHPGHPGFPRHQNHQVFANGNPNLVHGNPFTFHLETFPNLTETKTDHCLGTD